MKSVLSINCGECRLHLMAFLHGDVSPLLRRRIARHLDHCTDCYRLYLQELDLERDLKHELPLIGVGHQSHFDQVWTAVQQDIVMPRSTAARFHLRYGLAMFALVLALIFPLTLGDQNLTLASPPTQPAPLTQQAMPSGTALGTTETAAAVPSQTDQSQVTPEAPQSTMAPSLDVIRTP